MFLAEAIAAKNRREKAMLTGRRFKLERSTLSIGEVDGKRVAVTIPAGNTVKVIAGPRDGDRMIDVLWEGRMLVMFAIDLKQRGIELSQESAA
jgi:hypothetical protein